MEVDGVPRNQTWPERLIRNIIPEAASAVTLAGDVLDGKVDLNSEEGKARASSLAIFAILGTPALFQGLKAVRPQTTNEEFEALRSYVGSAYVDLNRYLRGSRDIYGLNPTHERYLNRLAQHIDSAIARHPRTTSDITVFRGVGSSGGELFNRLYPGQSINLPGFTSTSRSQEIGQMFTSSRNGALFEIQVPRGARALDITKVEGLNKVERELLLPRNSTFRVISIDRETRRARLELVPAH